MRALPTLYRKRLTTLKDKAICKIEDDRIEGYTQRQRGGSTQVFYKGSDPRDFERYRKEGGGVMPNIEMHLKPDTIEIEPPVVSYYAELIDGVWWWVNGCSECNGRPRASWKSYIECDKHNVCRSCGCSRQELTEPPYGGSSGWICKPCAKIEHDREKAIALAAMPDHFTPWDYHGLYDVKCPYCDYKFSDCSDHLEADSHKEECPRCDNVFEVTADHSVTFDCSRIEEKERGE